MPQPASHPPTENKPLVRVLNSFSEASHNMYVYDIYLLQTRSSTAVNLMRHNNLRVRKMDLVSDVFFMKGMSTTLKLYSYH